MDNSQGVPPIRDLDRTGPAGYVKDGDIITGPGYAPQLGMPPISVDLGTRPYDGSDKTRAGNGALMRDRGADHSANMMNRNVTEDEVKNPMPDSQDKSMDPPGMYG
jgi:hypothetical protein